MILSTKYMIYLIKASQIHASSFPINRHLKYMYNKFLDTFKNQFAVVSDFPE